ncbi:MAG: class I SAM-dependent methyltransferase [Bacteroidetes bacterium]|nr:class I SAM-dependent methyltransferase [Bacteroidota bacterium]
MTLQQAIQLLHNPQIGEAAPQSWVDLGCGSGLFSRVLAHYLPKGSLITGVDKKAGIFPEGNENKVDLRFVQMNFEEELPAGKFDGFLLANSLHYVEDQTSFLQKCLDKLNPNGRFLLVEYDTEVGNPWVPYPISYKRLNQLLKPFAARQIKKLGERPSAFGGKNLYACEVLF